MPPALAVLIIEHDMDLVFRFARRIVVLAEGAVLATSTMLAGLIYGRWSPGPFIVSMAGLSLLVAIALVARTGWWSGRYPSGRERPSGMARIGDIR